MLPIYHFSNKSVLKSIYIKKLKHDIYSISENLSIALLNRLANCKLYTPTYVSAQLFSISDLLEGVFFICLLGITYLCFTLEEQNLENDI